MAEVPAGRVLRDPVLFLAFGFGSGLSPVSPGTVGTLAAVPLYLLLERFSMPVYIAVLAIVVVIGIWLCGRAAEKLGIHDHSGVVWDEFAGYLLTMLPASGSWTSILAGFLLFRLFDIWKPWPIGAVDRRVGGGLGIMLDDLLAAVPAAAVLYFAADYLG